MSDDTLSDHPFILLVDDETAITDNLAPFLERSGFRVATAPNGSAALAQIEEQSPDLVVTDVLMPVMDGRELLRTLRDTGAVVRVAGRLLVGVPDVNGTRIEVSSLEVIEPGIQTQEPQPTDIEGLTADWPLFINDRYGYQVKYPPQAAIALFGPVGFPSDELPAGQTADQYMSELTKLYTDRLCIKIEYSLGWIYISAPENQGGRYTPCGPTGVGSGEIIPKIEVVSIGDQSYQADSHEVRIFVGDGAGGTMTGETLDLHYEMFMVELEDGTRIRWGSTPNHEATYEDFLMKTKGMLKQILMTYENLP